MELTHGCETHSWTALSSPLPDLWQTPQGSSAETMNQQQGSLWEETAKMSDRWMIGLEKGIWDPSIEVNRPREAASAGVRPCRNSPPRSQDFSWDGFLRQKQKDRWVKSRALLHVSRFAFIFIHVYVTASVWVYALCVVPSETRGDDKSRGTVLLSAP